MNEFDKKGFEKTRERDTKPIGNIILNLCGCDFCEAFGIDSCGKSRTTSCTDYIDDFIQNFYRHKQEVTHGK